MYLVPVFFAKVIQISNSNKFRNPKAYVDLFLFRALAYFLLSFAFRRVYHHDTFAIATVAQVVAMLPIPMPCCPESKEKKLVLCTYRKGRMRKKEKMTSKKRRHFQ
jgi:hypothetical protein